MSLLMDLPPFLSLKMIKMTPDVSKGELGRRVTAECDGALSLQPTRPTERMGQGKVSRTDSDVGWGRVGDGHLGERSNTVQKVLILKIIFRKMVSVSPHCLTVASGSLVSGKLINFSEPLYFFNV